MRFDPSPATISQNKSPEAEVTEPPTGNNINLISQRYGKLGVSVQGYGFQTHFCVSEVSKEEYEKCPPTEWGGSNLKSDKIFLSPILVEGFPENIDYMKEWGFK